VRLSDFGHGDEEMGLRILSYQVQQLYKDNAEFGVDLGKTKILPQTGFDHLQKCLFRLATHGQASEPPEHLNHA
jgi:predicted NACHT family NTPase